MQQSDWSDFPKTALEFEAYFASEEACHAYLMRQRWPEGFCCPACGGTKAWHLARRRLLQTRTKTINGELVTTFERWYPAFQSVATDRAA